ncbi:MAG: hypothetical protein AAGI15_14195 [Pseudomonadota bacterium]
MVLSPISRKQFARGRVHFLATGVLLVISGMWLGADQLMAKEPQVGSAAAERAAIVEKARSIITEVKVTAPRLSEQDDWFAKPDVDVAVGEPSDPREHWGEPSS